MCNLKKKNKNKQFWCCVCVCLCVVSNIKEMSQLKRNESVRIWNFAFQSGCFFFFQISWVALMRGIFPVNATVFLKWICAALCCCGDSWTFRYILKNNTFFHYLSIVLLIKNVLMLPCSLKGKVEIIIFYFVNNL